MPRFCANLTMLYSEHDFLDRFAAAAAGRLRGRRVSVPLRLPEGGARGARCDGTGWSRSCTTCRPATGPTASAASPACRAARASSGGVGQAIEYATALGCKQVNCLAGIAPADAAAGRAAPHLGREPALRRGRARKGRHQAPARAGQHPRHPRLLREPVGQAVAIIDEVGSDNLFLQYDFYHTQVMEGDLRANFQPAQGPDRARPDRRQSRPQRAGHRRDQLPLPLRDARPGRLRRLGRLRVQACGRDHGGTRLVRALRTRSA